LYYRFVVFIGRHPFWVSSRPVVRHVERVPAEGPFILASSHMSNYDVPILMRHTPRRLDFVSTTELFRRRFVGWFFGHMNAFPLERSRSDPGTVRTILNRLRRGRVVGIFPEGRIRDARESVVYGAPFRRGVGRMAQLAGVPIVPAVVCGGRAYDRPGNWLPLRRVRYGVIYGEPIRVSEEGAGERQLAEAFVRLYAEIRQAMGEPAAPDHFPIEGGGAAAAAAPPAAVASAPASAPVSGRSDRSQPA
jgi:1-acyl-sn-glycerol-3-phosphate acyltransferase